MFGVWGGMRASDRHAAEGQATRCAQHSPCASDFGSDARDGRGNLDVGATDGEDVAQGDDNFLTTQEGRPPAVAYTLLAQLNAMACAQPTR